MLLACDVVLILFCVSTALFVDLVHSCDRAILVSFALCDVLLATENLNALSIRIASKSLSGHQQLEARSEPKPARLSGPAAELMRTPRWQEQPTTAWRRQISK